MSFSRIKISLIYLVCLLIIFLAFLISHTVSFSVFASEPAKNAASVERGKEIFDEVNCLLCHKLNGEGGGLDENAPDLAGVSARKKADEINKWLKTHLYEEPRLSMFEEDPTDQDISSLTDYLQTL